jgi:hypothetical protein
LEFFLKIGHTGSSKWGKIFYKRLDSITAELQLSGLTGTASHPDIQESRIIGFFPENRLHWKFKVGKGFLQTAVSGYVFFYVQIKHKYKIPCMFLIFGGKFNPQKDAVQLQF